MIYSFIFPFISIPIFQFKLMLSHDGSGKGAALVAAVANRLQNKKRGEAPRRGSIV